ncbi:PREDICTED: purine permease 3-like [Ipomoea nil]|uniref:purine permease 3-like n=1 Tax=Ipomoea nil TaxID=35883 RepID=UPI0009016EE7|nr:PREDICTED: purine permease 3-like [Ipomoea nil]
MEDQTRTKMRRILLFLSCIILSIGNCGGPLLIRLYFLRGGNRVWFSSWLQTAGFPVIFIPLLVSYHHRRRRACNDESTKSRKFFLITPFLSIAAALFGVFLGVDNYLYSYGVSKLPVSTSSLIMATQLVFTAGFAFLLVKQKFTAFSINAVVLLTVGAVVLGLRAGSDRPAGESNKAYLLGFVLTVAAAALSGMMLPLIELSYLKAKQAASFSVVLEFQMIMGFVGTIFSTVGMIINKDFEVIPREAREFELGVTKYYVLAVFTAIVWQFFFVGALGVISYGSSLLSGVIVAVLLPVTEMLAVIFYHEKFEAEKGIALFLSIWGLVSYFYGDIKNTKKDNDQSSAETEMTSAPIVASTQAV